MLLSLLVIPTTAALLPGWRSPRAVVVAPMMTAAAPSGLSVLSVAELKRLLSERGVDSRDCLEKRDLIERLESLAGQGSSSSDGDGAPTSLTDDERRRIATFQRVSPSVAYIQTVQQSRALPFSMRAMEVPGGTGSGFVWDGLGHIVTNYHVVAICAETDVHGASALYVWATRTRLLRVLYVTEAQGSEPRRPHALYVLGARTHLGCTVCTCVPW